MRQKAIELNVNGWVRNLPDGRVEAVLEGPEESVNKLIAWCYEGPPLAKVDHVDITEEEYKGEFSTFSVRY